MRMQCCAVLTSGQCVDCPLTVPMRPIYGNAEAACPHGEVARWQTQHDADLHVMAKLSEENARLRKEVERLKKDVEIEREGQRPCCEEWDTCMERCIPLALALRRKLADKTQSSDAFLALLTTERDAHQGTAELYAREQRERLDAETALASERTAKEKAEADRDLWRNLAGATEGKLDGDQREFARLLAEERTAKEKAEKRIAEALAYVETHMDEDITNNGQANDGMSLRMLLEGRDG